MSTLAGVATGRETGQVAESSFDAFFATVWPDLTAYARTLASDDDAGDELAQEALTRVCVRWLVIREPRAYAFRIVTNLARDRWRSRAKETATWRSLATEPVHDDADSALLDAVQRLAKPHRDVLLLRYWADLPVAEVAAVLRRPEGTVKRRLSEARQALESALATAEAEVSP